MTALTDQLLKHHMESVFCLSPLTAGAAYIRDFIFLAHYVPHFKCVEDKM